MGRASPSLLCTALCLTLLVGVGGGVVPAGAQSESARVLVYLEVPSHEPPPTVLTLAGISLEREGAPPVTAEPRYTALDARDLAGTQILLADLTLPPALYTTLRFTLTAVRTSVGTAPVAPAIEPEGYTLALDLMLDAGGLEALLVRWQPARETGREQPYAPFLDLRVAPLPPLGSLALVTRADLGALVAVDRVSGRVVQVRSVGRDPRDLVYSPLQQKIYVALAGDDALAVVDALSLRLERVLPLQFGDDPERLALSADGAVLHVLNRGSRTLASFDARSLQERVRVGVGEGPRALALDPTTGQVYVACEEEGQVQVVDPDQGRVVAAYSDVASPGAVVFDALRRRLHVASTTRYRLFSYDLQEGTDLGSQSLCGPATDLVLRPGSGQLYAVVPACRQIMVLLPEAGLEYAPLRLSCEVERMVFSTDHAQFLATDPVGGFLLVGDPQSGNVAAAVETGGRPTGVVAP